MRRPATLAVIAGTLGLTASGAPPARGGETLAVRAGGGWVTWWQPADGSRGGGAPLADHIDWRRGADGIEWGEVQLRGAGEAWRTRVQRA